MYIKINGSEERYEANIIPFKTQHGNRGVEVRNGMPQTDQGFKVYDDNDVVVSDYSDYIYLYKENAYTTVEEEIEDGECSFAPLPESITDKLNKRVNELTVKVDEITPYTETKTAYYGEVEKVFYDVPDGILTVNMDGEFTTEKIEDRVYIRFERLSDTKDITIIVQ